MKKVGLLILLFSCLIESQNIVADCETKRVIQRNEIVVADTLKFGCVNRLLPMQDNSKITIRYVLGIGEIIRFDAGGGEWNEELGIDRRPGDANPTVVLGGCPDNFINLEIGEFIDVSYVIEECDGN